MMDKLTQLFHLLATLLEPLRFFKHAQERRLNAERELREHTLEILESVMSRMEKKSEADAQVLVENAKASQALGMAINTWFEMFKVNMDHTMTTSTVRPQDEWDDARKREFDRLKAEGWPVDEDPAKQLAFLQSYLG